MGISRQEVLDALRGVNYPGFERDIVSLGLVREVSLVEGAVVVELDPGGSGGREFLPQIAREAEAAIQALPGVREVRVRTAAPPGGAPSLRMAGSTPPPPSSAAAGAVSSDLIPEVRHTVAVASGKGGVGKSTVAVNLAVALARTGLRTGLLDADIYGPSIPLMMGIDEQPRLTPERKLVPFERYGVRFMSLGFLVEPDSAVIWRGPMVMKALEQLLRDVEWGPLDVLVVDLPPGTGDAQLTMSQRVRLAGALVVTTPQDVALADARKGVAMFRKVDVPVMGLVENMSYFHCPHCSERTEIFGHDGGRREAERLGVPCLAQVPLDPAIRSGGDTGRPIVDADPDSPHARVFLDLAAHVASALQA